MSRLVWSLVLVMLLHSFFTCAVAAGHVEDSHHAPSSLVSHAHQHSASDSSSADHEHQFHAHVSCITSYSAVCSPLAVPDQAIDCGLLWFDNQPQQPPVPPPNHASLHA